MPSPAASARSLRKIAVVSLSRVMVTACSVEPAWPVDVGYSLATGRATAVSIGKSQ